MRQGPTDRQTDEQKERKRERDRESESVAINPIQQMTFGYCCGSANAYRAFAY